VKLEVLTLDYDGTLVDNGVLPQAVRNGIQRARTRGIVVVLVTGRILDNLRRGAGDVRFVDAVVAENGAVLAFPETGRKLVLGHRLPETFLEELRHRGVPVTCGEWSSNRPQRMPRRFLVPKRDGVAPSAISVILVGKG
jgi:hydroxymethylpyrimidine pyrophosphatase-like HAD family hydrolase